MIQLRYETPEQWVRIVEDDLIAFLQDHAANEHSVSRAALTLAVQHPERKELVEALIDVALEELTHFKQVYELLDARGASLGLQPPDEYMRSLLKELRNPDRDAWLLHRLVMFAIVEARGFERFSLLGEHLQDDGLAQVYRELARSEARHLGLYLRLARTYFEPTRVEALLDRFLDLEATAIQKQPLRAALH